MWRILLLLGLLLLSPTSVRGESLVGADKAAHFGVSLAFGAGTYGALWAFGDDPRPLRLVEAVLLALLPGLGKELYDAGQPGNFFSGRDMAWNAAGALIGATALWLVDRFLPRRGSGTRLRPRAPAAP